MSTPSESSDKPTVSAVWPAPGEYWKDATGRVYGPAESLGAEACGPVVYWREGFTGFTSIVHMQCEGWTRIDGTIPRGAVEWLLSVAKERLDSAREERRRGESGSLYERMAFAEANAYHEMADRLRLILGE